jgi:hypothetical protein
MILDLLENPADFTLTISDYELFKVKVREAANLIAASGGSQVPNVRKPLTMLE